MRYENYLITIDWGGGFTSPPIGPIDGYSQAKRYARLYRERLRKNGRRATRMVRIQLMKHPEDVFTWKGLK